MVISCAHKYSYGNDICASRRDHLLSPQAVGARAACCAASSGQVRAISRFGPDARVAVAFVCHYAAAALEACSGHPQAQAPCAVQHLVVKAQRPHCAEQIVPGETVGQPAGKGSQMGIMERLTGMKYWGSHACSVSAQRVGTLNICRRWQHPTVKLSPNPQGMPCTRC